MTDSIGGADELSWRKRKGVVATAGDGGEGSAEECGEEIAPGQHALSPVAASEAA